MNHASFLKVAKQVRANRLAETNVQIDALFAGINARMASALETRRRYDALLAEGREPCHRCLREAGLQEHYGFCSHRCYDLDSRAEKAALGGYL